MSRFKKKKGKGSQTINTASLPDIIFMLLFFFMVSTTMRETQLLVQVKQPKASEVQKLKKKELVSYIYIGPPPEGRQAMLGTEPRIQLNDSYANLNEIRQFIVREREEMSEDEKKLMTTSLKVDQNTKMGIVSDVKEELRDANALKINYNTRKRDEENN
ncbi:MAG: biopolymer transporter ExbD [Bacteroidales bacterium]|nr:biopolymer transporter ExbD [Bacteroidales bacterium]